MTTETANGYVGPRRADYGQKPREQEPEDSDQRPTTPTSTPETEWKSVPQEYPPSAKSSTEFTDEEWAHTDDESDKEAPFPNRLDTSFSDTIESGNRVQLFEELTKLEYDTYDLYGGISIGGRVGIHLSKDHRHWRITKELQQMCLRDRDLDKTIQDAFQELDSILDDADVVARIERDNEEPTDPRPLLHVTTPVESANDWHDKKLMVRDIVGEVERGDTLIYTTVDRRN
jgi:hypothetical protein